MTCQHEHCTRDATVLNILKSRQQRAPSFYYLCDQHAAPYRYGTEGTNLTRNEFRPLADTSGAT